MEPTIIPLDPAAVRRIRQAIQAENDSVLRTKTLMAKFQALIEQLVIRHGHDPYREACRLHDTAGGGYELVISPPPEPDGESLPE